jgi:predicted outer membrane repeat protein
MAPACLLVTSLLDDGSAGTLRWQVNNALAGDMIRFDPGVFAYPHNTINLRPGFGEMMINKNLDICGADCDGNPVPVTINGQQNSDRIFEVFPHVRACLCNLTLVNGHTHPSFLLNSDNGGAILNQGDLTVDHVTFNSNHAATSGGAIETIAFDPGGLPGNASLVVRESAFNGNHAVGGYGGAISTHSFQQQDAGGSVTVTVDRSTFEGNTALQGGGGAIAFDTPYYLLGGLGTSSLTVTNSTFRSNEAADGGGILFGANHYVLAGTWRLSVCGSTFLYNDAWGSSYGFAGKGGAVDIPLDLNGASASALLCGCTLDGNWANSAGGGLSSLLHTAANSTSAGTVTLDQDTVKNNRAVWGGGLALDINGGTNLSSPPPFQTAVCVKDSTVDDNLATSDESVHPATAGQGGGIYATVQGNRFTLLDFVNDTVAFNNAQVATAYSVSVANGGGMYLTGSNLSATVSLNSLTVAYNHADNNGGGLYVYNPFGGLLLTPWVRTSVFDSNTVPPFGLGPDGFATVVSQWYNLANKTNSFNGFSVLKGDIITGVSAQLDVVLQPNGNLNPNPTWTLLPQAGPPPSPIIGMGDYFGVQFGDPINAAGQYYDRRGYVPANPTGQTTRGAVDPNGMPATLPDCDCGDSPFGQAVQNSRDADKTAGEQLAGSGKHPGGGSKG